MAERVAINVDCEQVKTVLEEAISEFSEEINQWKRRQRWKLAALFLLGAAIGAVAGLNHDSIMALFL